MNADERARGVGVLILIGAAASTGGVWLVAGLGWALLTFGVLCLALAARGATAKDGEMFRQKQAEFDQEFKETKERIHSARR